MQIQLHILPLHVMFTILSSRMMVHTLIPSLSHPSCNINVGEAQYNLSCAVTYGWMCGEVAQSFCTAVGQLSVPKERYQDCLMSNSQLLCGSSLCSLTCSFLGKCHSSTCLPNTSFNRPHAASKNTLG